MNSLINYMVESGVSLALLSITYRLFMGNMTFFRANRMFMLFSIVFSLLLPFFHFQVAAPASLMLPEVTVSPWDNLLNVANIYGQSLTGAVEELVIPFRLLVLALYLAGAGFFFARFLIKTWQIVNLIKTSETVPCKGYTLVKVPQGLGPFSFLRYLFVPVNMIDGPGYDRIIRHELEHIRQGHTYDLLVLEFLAVFQWFNPFIWLLRRSVMENHEYLADSAVVQSGVKPAEYKFLLLNQSMACSLVMASHFNYSLIKNRIKMISRIKSTRVALVRQVAGVVTAIAMLVVFACESRKGPANTNQESQQPVQAAQSSNDENHTVKTPDEEVFFIVEDMPEFPGGGDALRQFIASNIDYPDEAKEGSIQGKVFITFTVGRDGVVKDAKVARGAHPVLDNEALRVVAILPKWKPGRQKGVPVNVQYTVPVNFLLK